MKVFKSVIVIGLGLLCLLGCTTPPKDGYYKAVSFSKVDKTLMWGMTLGYMEFIGETVPYLRIENGEVITDFPIEHREPIESFKTFTGATYDDGRSLLDSIYKIDLKKDTLEITFHYAGTSQPTKEFVFKYLYISKEEYDKGVNKLFAKQEEVKNSFTTMDLSSLDYKQKRPAYLKEYESMSAMNKLLNVASDEDDRMEIDYRPEDLRIFRDTTYNFKKFVIKNSDLIGKTVANIDEFKFYSFDVYVDEEMNTLGIMLEQKEMKKSIIKDLLNNLKEKNSNLEMSVFGLPEKKSDGSLRGLADILAVKWYSNDKVVTLMIDNTSNKIEEVRKEQIISLVNGKKAKGNIDELWFYLNKRDLSDIKVFIMSSDFDRVIKANNIHNQRQDFYGYPNLKSYEYVWRGYYDFE
ncbi:hypothetical protein [Myroides marinus]|uniref:Uncharacterized protein n=1 Tax=Myroides marinus TaxID=703342 RepID=A0A1H6XBX2_9FLAO|nr:hypothetical protein [Myroides marinus]KUF44479.1 hypothetical protein AS361_15625 [Myroides marinus]MDM1371487.1 hypothetical protein [Myroides marinus]MDM1379988.1 hypothetical protein [Myroides marinus]MDM1387259.1 hypothetical protein [Myroides marinus]MDM1394472.1 hypothetical protein [Myroides marinus]